MMQVIKPGILVAVRTSVVGGVTYEREDIVDNEPAPAPAGATDKRIEKWKTTKIVVDPAEHEAASKLRSSALAMIRRQCVETSFGLLAPVSNEAALDAAIQQARSQVREFNDASRYSKISVSVLKGRVASTDEEAVRAVSAELVDLMRDMDAGIRRLDPAAIRAAAQKASKMQAVLGESQQIRVTMAVEAARKAAREIVRRVEKGGEDAAVVLQDLQIAAIETARVQFLELETATLPADSMPEVDLGRAAAVEYEEAGDGLPPVLQNGPETAPAPPEASVPPDETPRAPWWPGPAPLATADELLQEVAPSAPPAPSTEVPPPPPPPAPPPPADAPELFVPLLEF